MIFNDEQMEKLKAAEKHFYSAQKGWIKYATRDTHNLVADIYYEATGQKIPKTWSCSICVLNLYRKVGTLYFRDLKEREEIEASNELEPNALEDTVLNPPVKPVAKKNKKKDGTR